MARKAKTPKFEIFAGLDNCFDIYKQQDFHQFFPSNGPFTVELGCGKAELLLELARRYPGRPHVGLDVKSDRMYRPAQAAETEKRGNIAFVRAHASNICDVFEPEEVGELWITFPDPYPKKRAAKHRLLHPGFLDRYFQVLAPGAAVHFKTDNKPLFDWGLEQLTTHKGFIVTRTSRDLHADKNVSDEAKLLTTYERRFIGKGQPIYYAGIQRSDLNPIQI